VLEWELFDGNRSDMRDLQRNEVSGKFGG